jgi:hypothetical protein
MLIRLVKPRQQLQPKPLELKRQARPSHLQALKLQQLMLVNQHNYHRQQAVALRQLGRQLMAVVHLRQPSRLVGMPPLRAERALSTRTQRLTLTLRVFPGQRPSTGTLMRKNRMTKRAATRTVTIRMPKITMPIHLLPWGRLMGQMRSHRITVAISLRMEEAKTHYNLEITSFSLIYHT